MTTPGILFEAELSRVLTILKGKLKPWLVVLFGSCAKGVLRDDSDVDIAFMTEEEYLQSDMNAYGLFMVAQELAVITGRNVDLLDLRTASTVMQVQIMGKGKVVYCTDDLRRQNFSIRVFKEYALLNEERAGIMAKIKQRGSVYGSGH